LFDLRGLAVMNRNYAYQDTALCLCELILGFESGS